MRSLKKRGPHVLDDLNDLLFSLHTAVSEENQGALGMGARGQNRLNVNTGL